MTTFNVTPQSSLQATINGAHAGDTISFGTGTYNIRAALELKSGLSFIGNGSAVLSNTTRSTNTMEGDGVSNVTIQGLQFTNGPTRSGVGDAAIYLEDANSVKILNDTFSNIKADGAVFFYQSDNMTISNNTFTNVQEPVSGINNAGRHSGIAVSGNTMTGVTRLGIELQGDYSNVAVKNNSITINGGKLNTDAADAISIVNGSAGQPTITTNVVVSGNVLKGGNQGIEDAVSNMQVFGNTITNMFGGIAISDVVGANYYGNTFSNVTVPFGEDGGFTGHGFTIGTNTINAVQVTGWQF